MLNFLLRAFKLIMIKVLCTFNAKGEREGDQKCDYCLIKLGSSFIKDFEVIFIWRFLAR